MKKFLVLFMCFLLLGLVACQKAGAKALKKEDLDSQKKKVSYAIGLDIGKNFKTRSMDIDIAILFEGLKDSQKTGEPLLSTEEIQKVMTQFQQDMMKVEQEKRQASRPGQQGQGRGLSQGERRQAGREGHGQRPAV